MHSPMVCKETATKEMIEKEKPLNAIKLTIAGGIIHGCIQVCPTCILM